jgi:hypothetical protein
MFVCLSIFPLLCFVYLPSFVLFIFPKINKIHTT